MTSDDPAPGSVTVPQSPRVARPQAASSALCVIATFTQRMHRPVSEIADIETRIVSLILFSSTAGVTKWVLSVIW